MTILTCVRILGNANRRIQGWRPFDELDFKLRTFMKVYRYRRYDTTPHTPLQRSLAACRVALVTTAGLYTASQEPFDDHFKGRRLLLS